MPFCHWLAASTKHLCAPSSRYKRYQNEWYPAAAGSNECTAILHVTSNIKKKNTLVCCPISIHIAFSYTILKCQHYQMMHLEVAVSESGLYQTS